MAIKLDLSKAFDRIEWRFLLGVLKEFGFDNKFCGFIDQCISTTNISVLLNGSPTHSYTTSRCVRQGDPLSPYLFILCMEYLYRLLLNAETNHLISGVKAARNAPGITHLMFADDILIFAKADMHSINGIMEVLDFFGRVSGQVLNLDKSSVYFSHNIIPSHREILVRELKMTEMKDKDKYLGVSILIGRNKTKAFRPVMQSFGCRLKTWKGKAMNQSARTTMVKHALISMPTYQMSSFRIPKTMIDQMESIQKHFWWGHSDNKGPRLIGWNKLSIPKALGGLGFRNLEHFNTTLLTKIAWKACSEDNSLCMQIVRAKYGKNGSLLHLDKLKDDSSCIWRNIYSGTEIVQQHSMWIVQCGTKINIWLDNWIIGLNSPPVPIMGLSSIVSFTLVCDLFLPNTRIWNEQLIHSLFTHETATAILSMNVPTTGEDYLIWKPDRDKIARYKNDVEPHCNKEYQGDYSSELNVIRFMCTIWYIWKDSCNLIFQDVKPNVQSTVIRIQNLVQQCNFAVSSVTINRNNNMAIKKWIPLEEGFIKINIDASYIFDTRKGSIGLITRDFAGKALGVQGWNLEEKVEAEVGPEHFECKALVKAVEWMKDFGFNKVIFEMDCENVVNSICRDDPLVCWFNHHLILSVKNKFLSKSLWFCKSFHRQDNSVAHALARKAKIDNQNFSFYANYPPDIIRWVEEDYVGHCSG
ncbi:uncharacterized protein LOC113332094 [Papaver somniferum]|uniref:uncharacterized protein LOC113332094 n=1 Tax=Papaver somniferum TaxID=3469 RepID=UPI000E6FDC13|nr:uncharacterized protein LOC113332094 [Papaver somniferum]